MRKRIGLITICPEDDYQQRIMRGVFNQCAKYDYDVVVVTPMVQVANYFKEYLHGELNIYELINFDLLDGVIITPIPMTEDRIDTVVDRLLERIKAECKAPVVSAGLPFGDYPVVTTDDVTGFEVLTEHLITEHGCKKIAVLTGMKDYPLSHARLDGIRSAMAAHNLELDENLVYYGNFWYDSGEQLAARYLSHELELPDAVVCGNDAMAIGLVNALIKGGMNVPEDVIVTGYDSRATAALNDPPITSYAPDDYRCGAECVNYLHGVIEPGSETLVIEHAGERNVRRGGTCGCQEDVSYTRAKMNDSLYLVDHEVRNTHREAGIDIGQLMESYTAEILTNTDTPEHCLQKIYESKYLLQPYGHFYICLSNDWLDIDVERVDGYPSHMMLSMQADFVNNLHGYDYHVFYGEKTKIFPTSDMLPALALEAEKPQVYYFVPLHFQQKVLGYAVLQNDLTQKTKIGLVFRTYIRNIDNALEMTRAKNRISNLSEHDMMTGLLNRRGLDMRIRKMEEEAGPDDKYLCYVIDMDGLKFINDNYGHTEGDAGISLVARAARSICESGELSVRGGGDEFYVVGVGNYTEEEAEKRIVAFNKYLVDANAAEGRQIPITASIGYSIGKVGKPGGFQAVLDAADVNMYLDKRSKKNRR